MSVHWSVRYSTFAVSVWTLSLFFAGWREINTVGGLGSVLTLVSGVLLTTLLLGVQGYWVYFDEKSKGSLVRNMPFYESIHKLLDKHAAKNRFVKAIQPVVSKGKGSDQ